METTWLVVLILFLVIVVMGWQWVSARSMAGKANAELKQAIKQAKDAEGRVESAERDCQSAKDEANMWAARLKELQTARQTGGFDADRIYKLLAKGRMESEGGQRAYGVVQEDSGLIRPFMIDEVLDHLEVGDCFGILRGRLAKLGEHEFTLESGTDQPGESNEGSRAAAAAPVTELREAAGVDADTDASVPTKGAPQETVLFVPPAPEQPEDPNKGLPYLVVQEGDKDSEVYHLAFDRLTAGRGADNDIVLHDESASRMHLSVSFTENRFLLEDNNSTNGTICNGQTVSRKWLEFGDRIHVGGTTIQFSCKGYDLKDDDPEQAVAALEECVERQSDFIDALKLLAFMLERNVTRRKEAAMHWERIARLEQSS